ncbi:hybrid sensor histidine kinase/response regulator [Pseudacidovorax intermedius]|uniref:hybrid sensor histidine kinase/response regulator n=1 Tax=Pseudacidovorax intermedius TaxID=433924 RepID=UPI0007347156|nr:ATP-binding protein [Pseudacidovorax intermedius]
MRIITMQGRLMLIVSVAILPLALVCGLALYALLDAQQASNRATTLGVARAVAAAVDGELRLTIATLDALALTEPLGSTTPEGLAQARQLASAVRRSHPEWVSLLLAAPDGRVLFDTDAQPGAGTRRVVESGSLAQVLRTNQPAVGPMVPGPAGRLAFAVRVPVLRDGETRQVLTAVVLPEALASVLRRQGAPEGWILSVFDSRAARVARNVDDERWRGGPPSPSLQQLLDEMGSQSEGVGTALTADGVRAQTAVARLESFPWFVAVGTSVELAESPFRRSLLAYAAGLLVSLAFGAAAAWWVSRGVTRPMARLREQADALGRGEPIAPQPSGVPEVDAVGDALAAAAGQRQRHEAERQQLLDAERGASAAAQAAQQRLARLVSAGAVLSQSLEEEATLAAIGRVVVPAVGDLCRIDLLDEHGVLQRKLTQHFDPARTAAIAAMVSERQASSDAPGSFPWAIATGRTFLHNIEDAGLPASLDPQLRDFVAALGITAGCIVPLVARGRTIGAMAVLQAESGRRFSADDGALVNDLAQRAALALDNVRLLAQARAAQKQAEDANQAKDEFLAMLGHELRNPLAPIALALQLVQRRDPQAFVRERQIIERQVRHLSRMVDDLLDVSRIVSGKIVLRPEALDLRDVVARALELTLPALQQRGEMPQVRLPAEPVPVQGDALRLAQIVGNLLNNAAKFTDPGKAIRVGLAVEGEAPQAQAVLQVIDEGIGIDAALLPRVFERFVQAHQPLQRAAGGLGLGLAIARSLAQLHGGSILARSEGPGRGSTFELRLPLQATPASPQPLPGPSAEPSAPLALLVVDDNADAADALASWLELDGHRVRAVHSAEAALEALAAAPADGAICDIGLPGMSGLQLAERLRADPATAGMALVALTGYGREADRRGALDAGFDDHFAKPAQGEILLARLRAIVDARGPGPVAWRAARNTMA